MAEESIPVDLFNPGQVFACLGSLEAADVLLGDAEGGFDWSNETDVRFRLRANGDNPFGAVLGFIANAEVRPYAPPGWQVPRKKEAKKQKNAGGDAATEDNTVAQSESFPNLQVDKMALPIRLNSEGRGINVSHWADSSSRNSFKLYAGNRSAAQIAQTMLSSATHNPKKQGRGDVKTLWTRSKERLIEQPFDVLAPLGGSFNFDARGAWTGIDAGYSPNDQKHSVSASPVVEILAAIGLENARPHEYEAREVRYAVWGALLPGILARPVLAGSPIGVPIRRFRFTLDLAGKNKIVTFGQEEMNP